MSSIVKVDTIQENTSANGITVDGLNIKDSKLVTANSVVAANITADAIDATKIADNAISEEHLDVTSITGHTAETSIADGDLVLIHDASASALRKMTKANFVSGIGGTNTPNFFAYNASSGQAISNDTETVVAFDTEKFDTNNNFASNRFTPTTAGKYYLEAIITYPTSADHNDCAIRINKNGSNIASLNSAAFHYEGRHVSVIVEANGSGDYFEAIAYHNRGSSITLTHGDNGRGYFSGFKLIE